MSATALDRQPMKRYVLGGKRTEVHAVIGIWTLCKCSLAFGHDPQEVQREVDCPHCLREMRDGTCPKFPAPKARSSAGFFR